MAKTYFTILFFCSSIIFSLIYAQQKITPKTLHFGIYGGIQHGHVQTKSIDNFVDINYDIASLEAQHSLAFSLGIFSQIAINKFIAVRPQANIFFNGKRDTDLMPFTQRQQGNIYHASAIETPLHFIFIWPNNKVNPFLLIGGSYKHDFSKRNAYFKLQEKRNGISLEIGGGAMCKIGPLIFVPELIYAYGLTDLKETKDPYWEVGVSEIRHKRISLRLLMLFNQN